MATVSKKFVDINPNFNAHPISGDVPIIKNEDAIKQSVKNIVLTIRGEKPFRPFFGSSVSTSLFENFGLSEIDTITTNIEDALSAYEPRIRVTDIDVLDDVDANALEFTINYTIVGIPLNPQSLNLVLERV